LITLTDSDYQKDCQNKLEDLLMNLQNIQNDKKWDNSLKKTRQIRDLKK